MKDEDYLKMMAESIHKDTLEFLEAKEKGEHMKKLLFGVLLKSNKLSEIIHRIMKENK